MYDNKSFTKRNKKLFICRCYYIEITIIRWFLDFGKNLCYKKGSKKDVSLVFEMIILKIP